ncbi:MAG: cbb3-type cytochrome c oxidase subunit 3 [Holophagaceae bacterium]|nr:cbb3-type cytochrome c oxidase subunit 3 [Holophagaceae bacterium]
MKQAVLSLFPHVGLTVVGMLLFLGVFCGWCAWAFSRKRKDAFDAASRLPLED